MMREFVGFGAYEAACKLDEGYLQGWKPVVVGLQFDLSDSEVFRAVQDGVLDICRIIHNDCSIQLLIPLSSIRSFEWPYVVMPARRLRSWELLMLEADRQRGAWYRGITGSRKNRRKRLVA